jgi:hypothetical protein
MTIINSVAAETKGVDKQQCGSASAAAGQTLMLHSLYPHVPVTYHIIHCVTSLEFIVCKKLGNML